MELLEERLKRQARALGFGLVGIAPAGPADGFERLRDWLSRGFAGAMDYLPRHADARHHPASILPEVRSVVMVGMSYHQPEDRGQRTGDGTPGSLSSVLCPPSSGARGCVSRYARGADYHDVLRARLKRLLAWLQGERPGCRGRAVVDTAPLLERDYARRAGLGWFGK